MIRRLSLAAAPLALAILAAGAVATGPIAAADESIKSTTLAIKGMTCGGCVAAVKAQLKKTPGVKTYEVSLEKGEAVVTYDAAETDPPAIAASVSTTGFKAQVREDEGSKGAAGR